MLENIITSITNQVINMLTERYIMKTKLYKNKIYSEKVLMELMDYLEQHKFPLESFDLQCPVSRYFANCAENMTPDLAIINPETMQPLAFFRTYESEDDFKRDKLFDAAYHLNRRSNALLLRPYYIVIKKDDSLQFFNLRTILSCTNEKTLDPRVAVYEPVKYTVLQTNSNYKIIRSKVIDKNNLERVGKIIFSIIIPLIIVYLLILDGINIFQLTELRIIMYGFIIISLLIPYLTKITIKDFSISFKDKKDK